MYALDGNVAKFIWIQDILQGENWGLRLFTFRRHRGQAMTRQRSIVRVQLVCVKAGEQSPEKIFIWIHRKSSKIESKMPNYKISRITKHKMARPQCLQCRRNRKPNSVAAPGCPPGQYTLPLTVFASEATTLSSSMDEPVMYDPTELMTCSGGPMSVRDAPALGVSLSSGPATI